jgi:hypothetical protein
VTGEILAAFLACLPAIVLPGLALSAAIAPAGLGGWERALVALALGLCALPLLALALHVSPWDISGTSWAAAVAVVTAAATFTAWWRAGRPRPRRPMAVNWRAPTRAQCSAACVVASAALVAGGALWLAATPLPAAKVPGYALLWAVPGDTTARIGIENQRPTEQSYRLRIFHDGERRVRDRRFVLRPGERWEQQVQAWRGARIDALLYRSDQRREYRSVRVHLGP